MKTLSEHNRDGLERAHDGDKAGVACDKCGAEMVRTGIGMFIPVFPGHTEQRVKCPACGYEGVMEA